MRLFEFILILHQQVLWTFCKKRWWCQFFHRCSLKIYFCYLASDLKATKPSCVWSFNFRGWMTFYVRLAFLPNFLNLATLEARVMALESKTKPWQWWSQGQSWDQSLVSPNLGFRIWHNILKNLTNGMPGMMWDQWPLEHHSYLAFLSFHWPDFFRILHDILKPEFGKPDSVVKTSQNQDHGWW